MKKKIHQTKTDHLAKDKNRWDFKIQLFDCMTKVNVEEKNDSEFFFFRKRAKQRQPKQMPVKTRQALLY